jgi:hypothetical protein
MCRRTLPDQTSSASKMPKSSMKWDGSVVQIRVGRAQRQEQQPCQKILECLPIKACVNHNIRHCCRAKSYKAPRYTCSISLLIEIRRTLHSCPLCPYGQAERFDEEGSPALPEKLRTTPEHESGAHELEQCVVTKTNVNLRISRKTNLLLHRKEARLNAISPSRYHIVRQWEPITYALVAETGRPTPQSAELPLPLIIAVYTGRHLLSIGHSARAHATEDVKCTLNWHSLIAHELFQLQIPVVDCQ